MKKTLILALLMTLFILTACTDAQMTPTPFPATWTPGPALAAQQSFAVEINDLLASPETYADAYVQVTGRYQKRPLLICESESATNPSPATWELLDNNNIVLSAGAFDQALRALVPDGLTVTVAGYWQQWQGTIGCGKQADQQTIWFLEVTDILSPSPIVQVTLTPTPLGGLPLAGDVLPTAGSEEELQPVPTNADVVTNPNSTPLPANATATAVSNNPNPTNTPFNQDDDDTSTTATPNSSNIGSGTATATNSSSNSGSGTATPQTSATPSSSSGTPTATPATLGQATSTPRFDEGEIYQIDLIGEDELGFETLFSDEIHDWTLDLIASTAVTISLVADPSTNLGLEILDENGNLLTSSNSAAANQIETINALNVNPNNSYTIRVFSDSNDESNYVLLVWGNSEDAVVLDARDYLTYGQTGSGTVPAGGGRHFWFFYGAANDIVTINASTDATHLMLISAYDTEGDLMEYGEDELKWLEEEVNDITLLETGLYTIWVEEESFESADYTITVTKQ